MNIKVGDTIKITTGKDSGKQGKVEKILRTSGKVKVVVAGANLATKHQKDTRSQQGRGGKTGGRIELPMPIDVSNVMVVCPKCNLTTRIGLSVEGDSKKRVCKKCHKEL